MEKTYGVNGMIDWTAVIKTGKARLCVRFSGGTATKFGSTPAEFTTADPIVQQIIENSEQYRRNRIFLQRQRDTDPQPKAAKAEPTPPPYLDDLDNDDFLKR